MTAPAHRACGLVKRQSEGEMATPLYCECCGRELNGEKVVWLELDQRDNTYHDFNDVPESLSQGWFPFGSDCAKRKRSIAKLGRKAA